MSRTRLSRRRAGGFSLLEAIVTLVIVAMVVTVLMQALAQSLDMRERLLRHQRQSRTAALQEQWFREAVSSAVSDLPDALGRMAGSPARIEVLTPVPLVGTGLVRVHWEVVDMEGGQGLAYSGPGWSGIVVPPPLQDAHFSYLSQAGEWQQEWAPADDAEEVLPRMVRFQALTQRGALSWLVPVRAEPTPPRLLRPDGDDGI